MFTLSAQVLFTVISSKSLFSYRPIRQHFIPTLDQLKFEIEDGYTPEGARVRYDYDERLFPDFSWRGYAILTPYQVQFLFPVLYLLGKKAASESKNEKLLLHHWFNFSNLKVL